MRRRREILRLSCDYWDEMNLIRQKGTFDELFDFHTKIFNLSMPARARPKKNIEYSREIRVISTQESKKAEKDFLICLPPKAGCSNWEKGLAQLFLKPDDTLADHGIVEGAKFYDDWLYNIDAVFRRVGTSLQNSTP